MPATASQSPTPFLVATAIPYVNALPHLGHALLFTYGDVLARYQRSLGKDVIFTIGTDEHGGKVAEKAGSHNLEPQAFVDQMAVKYRAAAAKLGISYTHFIRTTDADHCRRVYLAWQQLQPYIYRGQYKGWYCQGCESYKTKTTYKETDGICPDHNQAYQLLEEENYLFKLSAFTAVLKQKIVSNELQIIPDSARAEVLSMLDQGLIDISISRPRSSVNWGISVPNDDSQVIYVWFEALLNYITVLGYPDQPAFKSHWPADIQVIGRDILRHHAVFWPAILLGLKLPLYRQLYIHGMVTVNGQKMAKTLGNSVDPLDLIETYSLDAFRYFFLRHLPAYNDGDYSLQRFVDAYNNELVNQLGNLVHRLQTLIWQKLAGCLPNQAQVAFQQPDLATIYEADMQACRFNQVFNKLFVEIKYLNQYLERRQPWKMTDKQQLATVLDQVSVNLRQLAHLLQPFIPDLAVKIEQIFKTTPISGFRSTAAEKNSSLNSKVMTAG